MELLIAFVVVFGCILLFRKPEKKEPNGIRASFIKQYDEHLKTEKEKGIHIKSSKRTDITDEQVRKFREQRDKEHKILIDEMFNKTDIREEDAFYWVKEYDKNELDADGFLKINYKKVPRKRY